MKKTFGRRLLLAREKRGLTLAALAQQTGIDEAVLADIEIDALGRPLPAEWLFSLADALLVSARWLAAEEGSMRMDVCDSPALQRLVREMSPETLRALIESVQATKQ